MSVLCETQVFRASIALAVLVALASVGRSSAQNVVGIDFGSEWIKLAVVQRSAGVQIILNEVTISVHASFSRIYTRMYMRRQRCHTQ